MDPEPDPAAESEHAAPVTVAVGWESPDTALVRIAGELDLSSIDTLEVKIAEVLGRRPARLIVDISKVGFADSSAITLWMRWAAAVDQFELRNPSPLLRTLLTRMGLAEKLAISP